MQLISKRNLLHFLSLESECRISWLPPLSLDSDRRGVNPLEGEGGGARESLSCCKTSALEL